MDRKNPFYMASLKAALTYAKKNEKAIWTLINCRKGVFHVYPGGRIVNYQFRHLGRSL